MLQSLFRKKLFNIICAFLLILVIGCGHPGKSKEASDTQTVSEKKSEINAPVKTILFFGNSLTAGYGLEPSESFPSLIQKKLDSAHLNYKTVNAGVSGETSSGGNGRIDWILKQPLDVFVLELGANDGLRGLPIEETRKNLQSIIDKVKKKYPQAKLVLAGMQIPPSMGQQYAVGFGKLFPELAKKNNMALIPFLLQNVAGIRELNQEDAIHPTAEGAKIVAENVWTVLQGVLN